MRQLFKLVSTLNYGYHVQGQISPPEPRTRISNTVCSEPPTVTASGLPAGDREFLSLSVLYTYPFPVTSLSDIDSTLPLDGTARSSAF